MTYVVALTTPPMVTSEHLSTATYSLPPKAMAASSNMSSSTQTRHEERQPIAMATSFIWQQIDLGINDLMHKLSKQQADRDCETNGTK